MYAFHPNRLCSPVILSGNRFFALLGKKKIARNTFKKAFLANGYPYPALTEIHVGPFFFFFFFFCTSKRESR
jgi:hypothetical protein